MAAGIVREAGPQAMCDSLPGQDLNLRPLAYEASEIPNFSTRLCDGRCDAGSVV